MSRLWHLLKKDFLILRWPLVAWLFLLGLKMWTRWQAERGGDDTSATLSWMVTISQSAMTVVLAFALTKLDSPASLHGQHRLWPVSPREWLAAKTCAALFWLVALPALLWWLLLLALRYGPNALILAEEDAAWRLLLVIGALAVPASSGRSPVMKAAWIIVAAGGVLIGGALGAEICGAAPLDPFAGDRGFVWAALPLMICCAAGFAGSFFDKTRRFAAMGLLLGLALAVAVLLWSAHSPLWFGPKFPPAPADFKRQGEIVILSKDVLRRAKIDSSFDWAPWLCVQWRDGPPSWMRVVPGSVSLQDARGKPVPLEAWPLQQAQLSSSLEETAAEALEPANWEGFVKSYASPYGVASGHDLGRISQESARSLFNEPGTLRADFEIWSIVRPRLIELPKEGKAPKIRNGFQWVCGPDIPWGYMSSGFRGNHSVRMTERAPIRDLFPPPLNTLGLRVPTFRLPGVIAWVPECRVALGFQPSSSDLPDRATAGGTIRSWVLRAETIQKEVRKVDPSHPLVKSSVLSQEFWSHVRMLVVEWELVSVGIRKVIIPSFAPTMNPFPPDRGPGR